MRHCCIRGFESCWKVLTARALASDGRIAARINGGYSSWATCMNMFGHVSTLDLLVVLFGWIYLYSSIIVSFHDVDFSGSCMTKRARVGYCIMLLVEILFAKVSTISVSFREWKRAGEPQKIPTERYMRCKLISRHMKALADNIWWRYKGNRNTRSAGEFSSLTMNSVSDATVSTHPPP